MKSTNYQKNDHYVSLKKYHSEHIALPTQSSGKADPMKRVISPFKHS